MNKIEEQQKEKKEQVFDCVTDLIKTQHFKDIGMREIAKHADVSVCSLYKYFGSKEELLKQVLCRRFEKIRKNLDEKFDHNLPFKENIDILFETFDDNISILNNEGICDFILGDPSMEKYFSEYLEQIYHGMIVKVTEQGKSEGELSKAYPPMVIVMFINSIGHLFSDLALRGIWDHELRYNLKNLFFYGISGKENAKTYRITKSC